MFSTQDNLTNPNKVDWLTLQPVFQSWECPMIQPVTQAEYNLIAIHDPHTIYHITDSAKLKMYYGDHEVQGVSQLTRPDIRYVIGPMGRDGNYPILMLTNREGNHALVTICQTPSITDAARIIQQWNPMPMDLNIMNRQLRGLLVQYIKRSINCNEFILGVLSMFQGGDHPDVQDVINAIRQWTQGVLLRCDLPAFALDALTLAKENSHNPMFRKYSDVYDVLVAFNYFKDRTYQAHYVDLELVDLEGPIKKIYTIMSTP